MNRSRYQQAMDDIHCPMELIKQIQQQSRQPADVSEVNDDYIYRHEKKPFLRYVFKAAVFLVVIIPSILLINSVYQSSNNESPTPSIQKDDVQMEDNYQANGNHEKIGLNSSDIVWKTDQQEIKSFLEENYQDFQWRLEVKEDGIYYELWNTDNEIQITVTPNQDIALVMNKDLSLEISLPYGFIPTDGGGKTAMYLHDTIGNADNQLVVISSVQGSRGETWDLDIYDLGTMTQIRIEEDVPWLASQMDLEVLSYYDERITFTLTVPDKTTYLMSDYVGEVDEVYSDVLNYDPLSVLSGEINEVTEYKLSEEILKQEVIYEINKEAPGLIITYSVTPYFMRGNLYCGKLAVNYVFDGERFVMERDSVRYLLQDSNINPIIVDPSEYQYPMNSNSAYKFTTWYLSGIDSSSNRLLIQLMKKAKEEPWVNEAKIITNGAEIPLKQLQNKTNIKVIWSYTGNCVGVSYEQEQPSKSYDNETFFVYDLTENKVVYEDALTFESMEEAFNKQGIYFMANPTWGEASESFKLSNVNEKDKILGVEYFFIDQNKYQRRGHFSYNYETGEYTNLVKNYQELTEQFDYWDNQVVGEDYKKIIIKTLEEELTKQRTLDTEMLTYLSPFLRVIESEEFSLIEYKENSEVYGWSGRSSYLIVWKPGYAKLIDLNGHIQIEEILKVQEDEFILIAHDYKFSNKKGIQLIRLIISNSGNGMEATKVVPKKVPEDYTYDYDGTFYSDTEEFSYTIEGSSIIFHNGKSEYKITY